MLCSGELKSNNQHSVLFLQRFLPFQKQVLIILSSANAFNLEEPNTLSFGNDLNNQMLFQLHLLVLSFLLFDQQIHKASKYSKIAWKKS